LKIWEEQNQDKTLLEFWSFR